MKLAVVFVIIAGLLASCQVDARRAFASRGLATSTESCASQERVCCQAQDGSNHLCPHAGGSCCSSSGFCCPSGFSCSGSATTPSCVRQVAANPCTAPRCFTWSKPASSEESSELSENSVVNAGGEVVRVPIRVRVDSGPSEESSVQLPRAVLPKIGASQSASAVSSAPAGDDGSAAVAGIAAKLPPGVTVTTTRNVGSQSITTTITRQPPRVPAPLVSESSRAENSESSIFTLGENSAPLKVGPEAARALKITAGSGLPLSSESSFGPLPKSSSSIPSFESSAASFPSLSSAPSLPSLENSSPLAPALNTAAENSDCAVGCAKRGKLRINSNVVINIGGKRKRSF